MGEIDIGPTVLTYMGRPLTVRDAVTMFANQDALLRQQAERIAAVEKLAERWERIASAHGVRCFTGDDHLIFANELRAALTGRAADGR